jgi:hypothetical protein
MAATIQVPTNASRNKKQVYTPQKIPSSPKVQLGKFPVSVQAAYRQLEDAVDGGHDPGPDERQHVQEQPQPHATTHLHIQTRVRTATPVVDLVLQSVKAGR